MPIVQATNLPLLLPGPAVLRLVLLVQEQWSRARQELPGVHSLPEPSVEELVRLQWLAQ